MIMQEAFAWFFKHPLTVEVFSAIIALSLVSLLRLNRKMSWMFLSYGVIAIAIGLLFTQNEGVMTGLGAFIIGVILWKVDI